MNKSAPVSNTKILLFSAIAITILTYFAIGVIEWWNWASTETGIGGVVVETEIYHENCLWKVCQYQRVVAVLDDGRHAILRAECDLWDIGDRFSIFASNGDPNHPYIRDPPCRTDIVELGVNV